jgi:hypothetical protein
VAGDARCRAARCQRVAHPGPFERPYRAGFAYGPAHLQCPSAD